MRARLDTEEVHELLSQLGPAACFPYMQPEQMQIRLHLKNYDERLLMSLLLKLAMKEPVESFYGLRNCLKSIDPSYEMPF